MENSNKLRLVYGDTVLGVHGDALSILFSYHSGGPVSLKYGGKEWIYRMPRPAFWRAVTDNDRGCGFPQRAAMWMGADLFSPCVRTALWVDGKELTEFLPPHNNRFQPEERAEHVRLQYTFLTATQPETEVIVSYTVAGDETVRIDAAFQGKQGLPELPAFGLRFVMPAAADGFRYEGLSGETYPDRMCGGVHGVYQVSGLPVTPYLVPQDCGMHMENDWLELYRSTTQNNADRSRGMFGLRVEKIGVPFAFSCLPYLPHELESATHQEELPPVRRTVLTVYGAVRGVGGIDSWGTDVQPSCHISAQNNHTVSVILRRAEIDSDRC